MPARPYNQYCGVARALDQIGERWSLLIIRDLLDGPLRYSDLQHSLAGVPSDMLANRLRHLEAAGIIQRDVLPPPAASKVYELTDRGRALEPAIVELARWGLELLGPPTPEDAFRAQWIALTLRSRFQPDQAERIDLTIHFDVDDDLLAVEVRDGRMSTRDVHRDGESPDVVVTAHPAALAAAARGETPADKLSITGEPQAVKRFSAVFGFTATTPKRQ